MFNAIRNFLANLCAAHAAINTKKLAVSTEIVKLGESFHTDPGWMVKNEWAHWSCSGFTLMHQHKNIVLQVSTDDETGEWTVAGISMNVSEEAYLAKEAAIFSDNRDHEQESAEMACIHNQADAGRSNVIAQFQ